MPGYNSQRRGTARTLPNSVVKCVVLVVKFVPLLCCSCWLCCLVYCLCVNVYCHYCHRVSTQLQLTNITSHNHRRYKSCSIHHGRLGPKIYRTLDFQLPPSPINNYYRVEFNYDAHVTMTLPNDATSLHLSLWHLQVSIQLNYTVAEPVNTIMNFRAHGYGFPARCKWEMRSSGILRSVEWYYVRQTETSICDRMDDPKRRCQTTILRWVKSQKNADMNFRVIRKAWIFAGNWEIYPGKTCSTLLVRSVYGKCISQTRKIWCCWRNVKNRSDVRNVIIIDSHIVQTERESIKYQALSVKWN